MTIPSKRQISASLVSLLIALYFCFGQRFSDTDNNKTFPNRQIEKITDFVKFSDDIFHIVAEKMGLEINESIPKPVVLTDKQISPQKFSRYLGWNVAVVCPYYFPEINTILIPIDCKLDSLAHELVHYFQVMYRNENLDFECGPYIENLEMEAVAIQRWFNTTYLQPRKIGHGFAGKIVHPVYAVP